MIFPYSYEEKTGFNQIREMLRQNCLSEMGIERVNGMCFRTDRPGLEEDLSVTSEFLQLLNLGAEFLSNSYYNAIPALEKAMIEGSVIEQEQMFSLFRGLGTIGQVIRFLKSLNHEEFPRLSKMALIPPFHKMVVDKLDLLFTREGGIRDNASSELKSIRSSIRSKQSGIMSKMQTMLKSLQTEGVIDHDTELTLRNGRLVLPMPTAYKRKIKGFVHDESATGKTSYVEPTDVFETNNEITELELAEQREIFRILREMTGFIRPYAGDLILSFQFLGEIDFIRVKALLARSLGACKPVFGDDHEMEWVSARHPLLFLHLKQSGKSIVPLAIRLDDQARIIVISGPNAGGKSVCLKTVGLIQYMLQCGLLVPVAPESRVCLFDSLMLDIGDEQSIEDDLSTYSSHLRNMKFFLKSADHRTLILIDEFGAGTEPQLGGAIAEAVLSNLNDLHVKGVITTHYTNLKLFASVAEGIINGAMLFDHQKLEPLFHLELGKPGSSFAFEIARKIGFPEEVLQIAIEKSGKEQYQFDRLLREVSRDKRYWENKRKNIRYSEKELAELIISFNEKVAVLDKEKKRILAEARLEAKKLTDEVNRRIEQTIRDIKEVQADKEKTRIARKNLESFIADFKENKGVDPSSEDAGLVGSIQNEAKKLFRKVPGRVRKMADGTQIKENIESTYRIGDKVQMTGQEAVGEIVELNEKNFIVAFGNILTTVPREKVERISSDEYNRKKEAIDVRPPEWAGT